MQETKQRFSEFGRYLYSEMIRHGVETVTRLRDDLAAQGYQISRMSISAYLKGERRVPIEFARQVASTLNFTEDEERELAWALYRWG